MELIKDVLYICNNLAASPDFRDYLLTTPYLIKMNELVYLSDSLQLDIYKLVSWGISVFCMHPITLEVAKTFTNLEGVSIDLEDMTEDEAEDLLLNQVFDWLLSIIKVMLS